MSEPEPPTWLTQSNSEYQKVVTILMNLATASLALPILYLKDFIGIKEGTPLGSHLSSSVYVSWTSLLIAIACGGIFYFTSAKLVKNVYKTGWGSPAKCWERIRDFAFWGTFLSFGVGLVSLLVFFSSSYTKGVLVSISCPN